MRNLLRFINRNAYRKDIFLILALKAILLLLLWAMIVYVYR